MSDTQFTLQDYAHAVDEADTQIHTAELCLRCRGLGLSDGCPLCALATVEPARHPLG